AEDGIRDLIVTGVQTCALPIWSIVSGFRSSIAIVHGPTATAPIAVGGFAFTSASHCSRKPGRRAVLYGSGSASFASRALSSWRTWPSMEGTTYSEYFTRHPKASASLARSL